MNEYAHYACVDGFRQEGRNVSKRCNKEAKWEGEDPLCVGMYWHGIEKKRGLGEFGGRVVSKVLIFIDRTLKPLASFCHLIKRLLNSC